jgi:streptogramin lyase
MTSIANMPIVANRTAGIALSLLTSVAFSVAHVVAASAADPAILTGAVTAPGGETMGGVTVSAKAVGSTITTSVFTDEGGTYYFPALPPGQYRVWAQALGFETAKGETELKTGGRQDFALRKIEDTEKLIRQLPGDLILAGLPDETADDMRMRRIVHNNCTSCHTPSYILQHRFDEAGWHAIIEAMKNINVYGVYRPNQHNPVLDFHQDELAKYLAKTRGPNGGAFKITGRPRPSGEAARAVFKEYDVPLNPDQDLPSATPPNNGSDWTKATTSRAGSLPHDSAPDLDGNLWFAAVSPNKTMSVGRIDARTGALKPFKIDSATGNAATVHGLIRDAAGVIWFNAWMPKGGLAKVDPKTEKVSIYMPPEGMSHIDGPVTLDYDSKGGIWAGTNDGALRFDPVTEKFTEFKSVNPKGPNGAVGQTYGIVGDRDGNGYWSQMAFDTIVKADLKTGTTTEMKLPPLKDEMARATAADLKFYDTYGPRDIGTPLPWSQGPRRMGIDREHGIIWVANSWSGTLGRVDTRTLQTTLIPLPNTFTDQPYAAIPDKNQNVWTPLWTTDQIAKYDSKAGTWTMFDLPTRGTEVRIPALLERGGETEVVFAYARSSKIAVLKVRSEADMAAAKAQAQ